MLSLVTDLPSQVILLRFSCVWLTWYHHCSDRQAVISQGGFNLHLLRLRKMDTVSCVYLYVLFHEIPVHVFAHFLIDVFKNNLLNFEDSFYSQDKSPLLSQRLANIFTYSVACFFNLHGSLAECKSLILMKFSLSILTFIYYDFGIRSENSSHNLMC